MPRARLLAVLPLLVLAAVAAALVSWPAGGGAPTAVAQQAGPQDDGRKPLVYVFSFDAMDGDRAIDQGRAPFLASLVRGHEGARATYYRDARGIMVSETNPNHVAMATGAYGERSGIPGNTFAAFDAAGRRGCPKDGGSDDPVAGQDPESTSPQVTSGEAATCVLAETFFTALERRAPDVVTAGIFGKPKLGKLFSQRLVTDGRYDADHLWAPCEQASDDPPYCRDVPIDPVQRYTQDPFVMDEVLRTVNEGVEADGRRRRPNLTFVNFPSIDQTGHVTGAGAAYEAMIAGADAQLRRFVENQKARGLWERTVLVVTSDHSMDTTTSLAPNALSAAFGPDADAVEVVLNGSVNMVYLKDRRRADRHEVLARLRKAVLADAEVDEALYREPNPADGGDRFTLDAVHPGWRIAGPRTGDLLVTAKPLQKFGDGQPGGINPLQGNHGAPQTLDHTFAIISGGDQVRQQALSATAPDPQRFSDTVANPGQSEQVDIAPTVMALFGQRPPADSQGRVLTEAFRDGVLRDVRPCDVVSGFRTLRVRPAGRGLRVTVTRRATAPVRVDVFRQSAGRRILGNRLVARFQRSGSFTWDGRGRRAAVGDGVYVVRVRIAVGGGRVDERRFTLRRAGGRFRALPTYDRAPSCGLLTTAKLERPVFGGQTNRALGIAFRLGRQAAVRVELLRGSRVVRRLSTRTRPGGTTVRLRLPAEGLARGAYTIRITATADGERLVGRLRAERL